MPEDGMISAAPHSCYPARRSRQFAPGIAKLADRYSTAQAGSFRTSPLPPHLAAGYRL